MGRIDTDEDDAGTTIANLEKAVGMNATSRKEVLAPPQRLWLRHPFALIGLPSGLLMIGGCSRLAEPAGPIARAERLILIDAMGLMLAIVVPLIITILGFAWWFRGSNKNAERDFNWAYSGRLELLIWSVPTLMIVFLGGMAWTSSHDLDPAKPLESSAKPLEIQVVALDWKWLFIYPQFGVASVNRLVIPAGAAVHFSLTSASVMNVFFIPRLGSQIYVMNGMSNQLNLKADLPGIYPGMSGHFSGDGFADMRFNTFALAPSSFDRWAKRGATGRARLDLAAYRQLLVQNVPARPTEYGSVQPHLYDDIVSRRLSDGQSNSVASAQTVQHSAGAALNAR